MAVVTNTYCLPVREAGSPDLSLAELCLLVHEWCLSAMSSLDEHGRESFGAFLIKAPREEASSGPVTLKGPMVQYHHHHTGERQLDTCYLPADTQRDPRETSALRTTKEQMWTLLSHIVVAG